jgi:hypothetical protein
VPKRIPWIALAISTAVVLGGGFAASPIRDAESFSDVAEVSFVRPGSYVAMAPLSAILDTLTLLSARQHIALAIGALVLFAAFRAFRAWRHAPGLRSHLKATGFLAVAIVALYAATAALPRPMARIEAADAHILRVDFHSHTSASHDGRAGFTAERNRSWHRAGGYDVAYITDHGTVAGAEQGMANNPSPAAEGVTLLQGIEVTWSGEHVVILGAERAYRGLLTENKRDVDEQGLRLASMIAGREPVVVWNHPRRLDRLSIAGARGTAGVRAIELVVGAPDNMDDIRPNRGQILVMADQRNLALTAGSDNHGWGRTAPGWTLLRIYGWRAMAADSLGLHIERVIRENGFRGTRVIQRSVADPGSSALALAATVFAVPARMLTTLSNEERVVWLVWIWLLTAAIWWRRRS